MDDSNFAWLFASYWWLLFPLGFFVAAGFRSLMAQMRLRQKVELAKAYAAAGKDIPPGLLDD